MRFQLYEKKVLALSDEEAEESHQYVAIPEDKIKVGLVVPASNPDLAKEPVGEIEADNPAQAVHLFRDRMANLFG